MRHALFFSLLFSIAACGNEETGPEVAEEDEPARAADHHHEARYGGELIPLGEHEVHLELSLDPKRGALTLYVWDGHVSNALRVKHEAFDLELETDGGKEIPVRLEAVANRLTGETVGDTSKFEAVSPDLKGIGSVAGVLPGIVIRGKRYEEIDLYVPAVGEEEPEEGHGCG